MEFNTEIFSQFDKTWGLLCAGERDRFNAMTISWGGLGTLWGKSVATVYVKPIRHTWQYLEENEFFTIGFFPEAYRQDLLVLGTLSGRDGDKLARTTLTPVALEGAVAFREAERTLLCRKIYWQDLDRAHMPRDVVERFYTPEEPHRLYIGEVVAVLGPGAAVR